MCPFFADEKRHRIPASAPSLPCQTFQSAAFAEILISKGGKLSFWPHFNTIKLAFPCCPRKFSSSSLGLRQAMLALCHASPLLLRLADILLRRTSLFW